MDLGQFSASRRGIEQSGSSLRVAAQYLDRCQQFRDNGVRRSRRFSPNKAAAKDFIRYVTTEAAFHEAVEASKGYDIPPYERLHDFDIWKNRDRRRGSTTTIRRGATSPRS